MENIVKCIGEDNKYGIIDMQGKLKLIEKDIDHINKTMVSAQALGQLELKIAKIEASLQEMQNNRMEDRQAIYNLNVSIQEVRNKLEEYLKSNAEIIANQMMSSSEQNRQGLEIINLIDSIKEMNSIVSRNSIINQIKEFKSKSKFNLFVFRFSVGLTILILFSAVSFFLSGGVSLYELLKLSKEFLGWVGIHLLTCF